MGDKQRKSSNMIKKDEQEQLPILYKKNRKGVLQQWQIHVHKNMYYSIEGLVGGKLTPAKPTVITNIKRGYKSIEELAFSKAKAIFDKKKASGYYEVGENPVEFFRPMLAFELKPHHPLFMVPTYVQPKLDGLRCASFSNILQSRNGKIFTSCPHLHREESEILDGELYNHALKDDFNTIISLTRKKKLSQDDLDRSKDWIEFHLYDMPMNEVFSVRYKRLEEYYYKHGLSAKGYRLVPTKQVKNMEELEAAHLEFLSLGYEGTIIRLDIEGVGYENHRSNQLLKKKDWQDDEFTIVGWEEGVGNRSGTIGKFYLEDPRTGAEFESNVKGDFEYLKELWEDIKMFPDNYKGLSATVKFFRRTPAGIPRFPLVIKLGRELVE